MRFIRYYSKLLDAQGVPRISVEQHKRLFNIVTLESRINELEKLKTDLRESDLKYNCELQIFRLSAQLKKLTNDFYPKDLMDNMLWESQNH